ncbi:MAG: hypothetical protein K8S21_06620 [Gemmatimonadetes bacterium]|nr:hypothetical protein [Gemmatimonadota bacterium]
MRDALRALRDGGLGAGARGAPLEVQPKGDQPPRLERATPLEGTSIQVRAVPGEPVVGFRAFLDGIQRSQVLAHAGGVPIVHGAVAAAIRVREARRMHTWGAPRIDQALYAPHALLEAALLETLLGRVRVVDTLRADGRSPADDPDAVPGARHPQELVARALTAVQRAREAAESALAADWVASGDGPLLVDGGTSASAEAARSAQVIGVVKSHRTLYADEAALPLLLGLREGERTTAMTLSSPRRHAVASWYLRLRDPASRSPLFGLVRVEAALVDDITSRADVVSRWLLAERAPVSLPDQRWDVMVYGIRECEQYLTAILK